MKRVLLGCLMLAGCASSTPPDTTDPQYQTDSDAGQSAFDVGSLTTAQSQYEAAYKRALRSNDAVALHDAGYNLAIVRLAAGHADQALTAAETAETDLALRGLAHPADLEVVRAAGAYRLGRYAQAVHLAAPIAAPTDSMSRRAAFIAGISADALGQTSVMAQSLAQLGRGKKAPVTEQADYAELAARFALRQGNAASALSEAEKAAGYRRETHEYRGMIRALHLASVAATQNGQPAEARRLLMIAEQSEAQGAQSIDATRGDISATP